MRSTPTQVWQRDPRRFRRKLLVERFRRLDRKADAAREVATKGPAPRSRRGARSLVCASASALLRLEQRRDLGLGELGRHVIEERHVGERDPATLGARIDVEVLVLDTAWLDRQEQEITGLPVDALAVDHRIAFAGDHVDDEATLVPVLAGLGLEVVRDHTPVL